MDTCERTGISSFTTDQLMQELDSVASSDGDLIRTIEQKIEYIIGAQI